jgi:hypothetical protein
MGGDTRFFMDGTARQIVAELKGRNSKRRPKCGRETLPQPLGCGVHPKRRYGVQEKVPDKTAARSKTCGPCCGPGEGQLELATLACSAEAKSHSSAGGGAMNRGRRSGDLLLLQFAIEASGKQFSCLLEAAKARRTESSGRMAEVEGKEPHSGCGPLRGTRGKRFGKCFRPHRKQTCRWLCAGNLQLGSPLVFL